jgi:nascent polypeptide-associated complex subunit alpha
VLENTNVDAGLLVKKYNRVLRRVFFLCRFCFFVLHLLFWFFFGFVLFFFRVGSRGPAAMSDRSGSDSDDEHHAPDARRMTRAEKKAFKAIRKLNLDEVTGFKDCFIRVGQQQVFQLSGVRVFKGRACESYVIFGAATAAPGGGGGAGAGLTPEQQLQMAKLQQMMAEQKAGMAAAAAGADAGEAGDDDASGLEEKDIELVMTQGNVARPQAIAALKKNGGDIVNAIMELSDA